MLAKDVVVSDPASTETHSSPSSEAIDVAGAVRRHDAEDAAMRETLQELWGPEEPYTAPPEATSSLFSRLYFGWVYDTLILASKENLSRDALPSPTKDVLSHDCGLRLSESIRSSLEAQGAWDALIGVSVTSTLDPSSRGVLRWVGVPQQGGYTRMMAGIEWSSPPAARVAAKEADASNSPFFDGVVHGEKLFVPARVGVSTLEETNHVTILAPTELKGRDFPPPQRLNLTSNLIGTMPRLFWSQLPFATLAVFFQLSMPYLLQVLVQFFNAETHTWGGGLKIVAAMFCVQCAQSFCQQRYNYLSVKGGLQYRSALNSVIFEKCFTISNKALSRPEMNAGRIINMVSTDVERVYFFMMFCMMLYSSPMLLLIAMGMLGRLVGWCAILALIAFLLTLPINARLMNAQMNARRSIAKATDIRVKATNEFLSGIRVTKFMTWEPRFIANIEAKRAVELYYLKKIQTYRVQTSFLNTATPMVMIAIVFITYYNLGHDLTPEIVFPTISLLSILRQPFQQIPWVLTMTLQYLVSISRVRSFLECENTSCSTVCDMEAYFKDTEGDDSTACGACRAAAVMDDVSVTAFVPVRLPFAPKVKVPFVSKLLRMMCCEGCKPAKRVPPPMAVAQELDESESSPRTASSTSRRAPTDAKPPTQMEEFYQLEAKELLSKVDLQVPAGKLTVVLGPTGSGKSTLLQTLLGQFEITHGRVWTSRNIAYVPQQAWIMNATVRNNILFFSEEDDAKLKDAIRVSQLGTDLELLGGGLETEIGEKGVNLSGGQKARVSLARAVYAERDVYLLDDPLSALDAHVGERIVTECVLGKLAGKTRVLATHQMHVVPRADYVVVLGDHTIRFQGDVQAFTDSAVFRELSTKEENEAREKEADEEQKTKAVEEQTKDLIDQGQSNVAPARSKAAVPQDDEGAADEPNDATLIVQEEKAKGGVPLATYLTYFAYCGGTRVAVFAFVVFVVTELLTVSSSVWLSAWSTMRYPLEVTTYLKVYLVLVLLGTCSVPLRYTVSYTAMRRGCVNLHKALLRSVSRGTMEFFDRTPLGRLLNRFSRDIDQIDNGLQMSMISALECFFAISSSMLIMIVSQPIVIVALIPCGYVYYRLMIFFNMANREIRRTSSIMKTPVYTLLGELTNGSATIAAYEKSGVVMREAIKRLDVVLSCGNLENVTNRWLAVRIEFLSYVVVTSIAFAGVLSTMRSSEGSENDIGLASLAVTMAMQTTGSLNWLVRQVATVEADMNSIERIQYYVEKIPKEDSPEIDSEVDDLQRRVGLDNEEVMETGDVGTVSSPIVGAPSQLNAGSLVFDHVQMRYREGLPLVLRDVSFRIAPREKVGIVGRTGSGKSTLLLTFMRMVDVSGGSITVNGAGIRSFGLRELRKLFSMIPQDPVLFDGTVRLNVDPFLESSTEEVWSALDMVGLRDRVSSESEGVDARVQEGGANFSVGQRQLLCMARALLKKGSGFILMDEATANIDPALDRHIQKTVMRAFDEYTVITIAHRLQTVAQYDKIIVMDHGVVAEMGSPRDLVAREGSIFRGMVESMGTSAYNQFMALVDSRMDDEKASL